MASGVYRIAKVEVAWACAAATPPRWPPTGAPASPRPQPWSSGQSTCWPARLRIDPAELRRRNLIPTRAFPYTTATRAYDSGDYQGALDRVLAVANDGLRAEQAARQEHGATSASSASACRCTSRSPGSRPSTGRWRSPRTAG